MQPKTLGQGAMGVLGCTGPSGSLRTMPFPPPSCFSLPFPLHLKLLQRRNFAQRLPLHIAS